MNTASTRSRIVRLAAASLTALACGVIAGPALAVVNATTGAYQVSLYENSGCEGSHKDWAEGVPESGSAAFSEAGTIPGTCTKYNWLGQCTSVSWSTASWSICNNTGWTLWFTFKMYTGSSQSGTETDPITNMELPTGVCFTGNTSSTVESIGWDVYTTAQ